MPDHQRLGAKIDKSVARIVVAWGMVTLAASVALLNHGIPDIAFAIIVGIDAVVNFGAAYAAFKRWQRTRVPDAVITHAEHSFNSAPPPHR